MKNKIYDYGEFDLDIGRRFKVKKVGWHLVENFELATSEQQKQLEELGWGKDVVTFWGAEAIIQSILEIAFENEE